MVKAEDIGRKATVATLVHCENEKVKCITNTG